MPLGPHEHIAQRASLTSQEDPRPAPPSEVVAVRGHRVSCEGAGGALGHPRVWLEMGGADFVVCGYCGRRFVQVTDQAEDERLAPGAYDGAHGH